MSLMLYREEQSELYLELGHVCLYYLQYDSAKVGLDYSNYLYLCD